MRGPFGPDLRIGIAIGAAVLVAGILAALGGRRPTAEECVADGGRYSPDLARAFLEWSTLAQSSLHGMSKWPDIPNWEYNEKRAALVALAEQRLSEEPDDFWARWQNEALIRLPNITRGGLSGSSDLRWWAALSAGDALPVEVP